MSNVVWINSGYDWRLRQARKPGWRGAWVMSDLDFEMKLDRLFNEPPAMPDSEAFARLVEMRLDRGWTVRQLALGAARSLARTRAGHRPRRGVGGLHPGRIHQIGGMGREPAGIPRGMSRVSAEKWDGRLGHGEGNIRRIASVCWPQVNRRPPVVASVA
jgi:hypothetical protein